MRLSGVGLALTFVGACVQATPQATTPTPDTSTPVVAIGETADTSTGPVYVLDGNVVPSSALTSINPKDIASVTVLKGPKAVAAYGPRARNGAIEITLLPPDARADACRPPTPRTAAVASILLADLVRREPYTTGLRVGTDRTSWPMVRLYLKVLHGWKRNPLLSNMRYSKDTLILSVTPEQDPALSAGTRLLAFLQLDLVDPKKPATEAAPTRVEQLGTLALYPCDGIKRMEEAQVDLTLLGPPDWHVP